MLIDVCAIICASLIIGALLIQSQSGGFLMKLLDLRLKVDFLISALLYINVARAAGVAMFLYMAFMVQFLREE